ncbi:AAA family ATPase [Nocardia coubleae]|uniref:AAA family ATPase n=1 Tax=Nocardia coubleae TaxID=356147 RepID=A0A846W608_9NOCA|nr:AAA family ATPase [Nocardia coubleae]
MDGTVIILTGPPGAGKSTVADAFARKLERGVHLHTDDFWHYIVAGAIPPYEPASARQNQTVMNVIAGAAFTYAAGGFTTVLDGIVGPWMLHHFRDHTPGIALHYVVLRPGRDITLSRAKARTAPQALVDEQPIATMWDQFASLGDYEPHVLDTSTDDAHRTIERVTDAVTSNRFRLHL